MIKIALCVLFVASSILEAGPTRSISVHTGTLFSDFGGSSVHAGFSQTLYNYFGGEVSAGYSSRTANINNNDVLYQYADLMLMFNYPLSRHGYNEVSVHLLGGSMLNVNIAAENAVKNRSNNIHSYLLGMEIRGIALSKYVFLEGSVQYSFSMKDIVVVAGKNIHPSGLIMNVAVRIP
ncbi:MAG: hypothetical protein ACOYNS_17720 [Bacteroidota bacterium]